MKIKFVSLLTVVVLIFSLMTFTFVGTSAAEALEGDVNDTVQGDLNGDNAVTAQDAVYLMYHTLYSEDYALNQDADFDASGSVDSDDAVYLLYYVLYGAEEYPLPDGGVNVTPGNPVDPDDDFEDWIPIV